MDFNSFCNKVLDIIQDRLRDEAVVALQTIEKNNGIRLKGLSIRPMASKISPTLYLEKFYEMYMDGICLSDVIEIVIHTYEENRREWIDVGCFYNYEKIKSRIIYKLIDADWNSEMLTNVPYVQWNDLAIVFCYLLNQEDFEQATILIRNEHMKMWSVDVDELYERAKENTPILLGEQVYSMDGLIRELVNQRCNAGETDEIMRLLECEVSSHMYVITNKKKVYGATSILYTDMLRELSNQYNCGVYAIPSSVHEMILIPEAVEMESSYMYEMIREVNESDVGVEDRLSNTLYYYDPVLESVTVAPFIDKQVVV